MNVYFPKLSSLYEQFNSCSYIVFVIITRMCLITTLPIGIGLYIAKIKEVESLSIIFIIMGSIFYMICLCMLCMCLGEYCFDKEIKVYNQESQRTTNQSPQEINNIPQDPVNIVESV